MKGEIKMYWGSKYCVGCVNNRYCFCKASNSDWKDITCLIYKNNIEKIFEEAYNKVNNENK